MGRWHGRKRGRSRNSLVTGLDEGLDKTSKISISAAATEALGFEVPREVGVERWTSRRLVADHYRDGNVFLASDATHLAWVLAAEVHGWAGHRFLDAYEIERRPIGDMVSNQS